MLLASTESSPLEPVSFTRSLPARSTKHSVPCLLGQALAWETRVGEVMLWPPSPLPHGPQQCPDPWVLNGTPCCSLQPQQCTLEENMTCLQPPMSPEAPSPPLEQDVRSRLGRGCGWSEGRGCGSSAC